MVGLSRGSLNLGADLLGAPGQLGAVIYSRITGVDISSVF
jgi:hypothetical protein